jgi:hypothetical protein
LNTTVINVYFDEIVYSECPSTITWINNTSFAVRNGRLRAHAIYHWSDNGSFSDGDVVFNSHSIVTVVNWAVSNGRPNITT